MEQLELISFEREYISIHDDSVRHKILYEMSLNHPINDVAEISKIIIGSKPLSVAEVLLTSNLMLCRRIRMERTFNIKVNDSDEKVLEWYVNQKFFSGHGSKKKILFRYSVNEDKTKLLCDAYLQIKKSLPHMEEFSEQKKLKIVAQDIRKSLIFEITTTIMDRISVFVEADRPLYMSYLEIKNCLPRGLITTQKAIEIAKEINQKCSQIERKIRKNK